MEIITIVAIFLGPIFAIIISIMINRIQIKKDDKLWIFRTLMRTRANTLSNAHIEALNMIDVTFHGNNKYDSEVVAAWKLYLDSLSDLNTSPEILIQRRQDLLIDLLKTMSTALSYNFTKESLKNTTYIPEGHVDLINDQKEVRVGVIEVLNGKRSIPISFDK